MAEGGEQMPELVGQTTPEEKIPNLDGAWECYDCKNFHQFLHANGASTPSMYTGDESFGQLVVKQDGHKMSMALLGMKPMVWKQFVVGGPAFLQHQHNGSKMLVRAMWEGEKLVMSYLPLRGSGDKIQRHTRYLEGDNLVAKLEINSRPGHSVVAWRYYRRTDDLTEADWNIFNLDSAILDHQPPKVGANDPPIRQPPTYKSQRALILKRKSMENAS